MGQNSSGARQSEDVVDEVRQDAFSLWPGLDYHMDLSFNALDTEKKKTLPYSILEPVLRHHLMQIGLIEYVTRFATPDGQLSAREVSEYLKEYGIDVKKPLGKKDWKNLMLAWIRRVHDAQAEDIKNWHYSLKEMQKDQSSRYQNAMKQFQRHYIEQLETYYKSVEESHKKEEAYREEWESSLGLQEEFYNTQMEYLQERNEAGERMVYQQKQKEQEEEKNILKFIETGKEHLPGNITATTFTYPATLTTTGAPVSGGAQAPTRRLYKREKAVCC